MDEGDTFDATHEHIHILTEFTIAEALETENVKLDESTVRAAWTYLVAAPTAQLTPDGRTFLCRV